MTLTHGQITKDFSGVWNHQTRLPENKRQMVRDFMMKNKHEVNVADVFTDARFLSANSSWYRSGEAHLFCDLPAPVKWRRLLEMSADTPYPQMDYNSGTFIPRMGRVYQGPVDNFYFIQALHAVGQKWKLVENLFANMQYSSPKIGFFIIRFYKHAQWHQIEIDDALPFDHWDKPYCATGEFFPTHSWPCLVEKAYAKLHGSWEALGGGGHVEEALTDLTGGCSTRYSTTDVAQDRLWQYLYLMQNYCIFALSISQAGCSRRQVPLRKNWAAAIYCLLRHEDAPYVCVCTSAPVATLRHMPLRAIPGLDGLGMNDGYACLSMDDFVTFFDTIYECRLVNSDLGPPSELGIPGTPGWVMGQPFFEQMWAYRDDLHAENTPCFLLDVRDTPNELTMDVSQTDHRFGEPNEQPMMGRHMQAPLLMRVYQCSREVDERRGGEVHIVHMSSWGHTRDASCCVKVMSPGKYLVMISMPMKYISTRMIFRIYSTRLLGVKVITEHSSFIAVHPTGPLNAIPFSMGGFQRVDQYKEQLPQMFDENEGKGEPRVAWHLSALHQLSKLNPYISKRERQDALKEETGGYKVVGEFGGRGAIATTAAAEDQEINCSIM